MQSMYLREYVPMSDSSTKAMLSRMSPERSLVMWMRSVGKRGTPLNENSNSGSGVPLTRAVNRADIPLKRVTRDMLNTLGMLNKQGDLTAS